MNERSIAASEAARVAVQSRLPILPEERVFTTAASFFWTFVAIGATGPALLLGAALPHLGSKEVALFSFIAGLIVVSVPVLLSAGIPSSRLGVDTIEVSKSAFGVRGVALPLAGLVTTCLGVAFVVAAMTSRAFIDLATASGAGAASEFEVRAIGFAILVAAWFLASRGPQLFERLGAVLGPALTVLTLGCSGYFIDRHGFAGVLRAQLPAPVLLTTDRSLGFMIAFEWGAAAGIIVWPLLGALTRLVRSERHVVSPAMFAACVVNCLSVILCGALAQVLVGGESPLGWLLKAGGPILGTAGVVLVLVCNVNLMVINLYTAGVAIQYVFGDGRGKWKATLAVLLAPGLYLALYPDWVLAHVTTFLTYGGVIFAGMIAVTFTDYYVLRRQRLDTLELFRGDRLGRYYFWAGINYCALAAVAVGVGLDLWLFDPVTLTTRPPFPWVGATVPTLLVSGLLYYALSRLCSIPAGRGGYLERT